MPITMTTTADDLGQLSFDELGTPLRETTFVVVDLETTGSRAGDDAIRTAGDAAWADYLRRMLAVVTR